MTTTQVINTQSIGTGANVSTGDSPLFVTKRTLATTTTAFSLTGILTNGASRYGTEQRTKISWTTSPVSLTANAATAAQLKMTAKFFYLKQSPNSGDVRYTDSDLDTVTGPYLYLWAECPNHPVAQTLDVYVNELP